MDNFTRQCGGIRGNAKYFVIIQISLDPILVFVILQHVSANFIFFLTLVWYLYDYTS